MTIVQSENFCTLTRASVNQKCENHTNMTTNWRSKQLNRCLKTCNYTDDSSLDNGCDVISEQNSYELNMYLIIFGIIILIIIIAFGVIVLGYYIRSISKNTNNNLSAEEEKYYTIDDNISYQSIYEPICEEEKSDYDDVLEFSNDYDVMNDNALKTQRSVSNV